MDPKKNTSAKSRSAAFGDIAKNIAYTSGRPITFFFALLIIGIWAVTGPLFHFNDTWQLVINTVSTIITFLMVFLIQNTQTRDSAAVQIKLDELVRALETANNAVMSAEDSSQEELDAFKKGYVELAGQTSGLQPKRINRSSGNSGPPAA